MFLAGSTLTGEPVILADAVAAASASLTGLVAYRASAEVRSALTWFDRAGAASGAIGTVDRPFHPHVSADGRRVAVADVGGDIWLVEGGRTSRFTFDGAADDLRLLVARRPLPAVWQHRPAEQRRHLGPSSCRRSDAVGGPEDALPGGSGCLLARRQVDGVPLERVGAIRGLRAILRPAWRPDSRALYDLSPAGEMMTALITATPLAIQAGTPVVLFRTRIVGGGADAGQGRQYHVAPDGRFLINTVTGEAPTPPITLIQNWTPPDPR